jgi:hypothetical protein
LMSSYDKIKVVAMKEFVNNIYSKSE